MWFLYTALFKLELFNQDKLEGDIFDIPEVDVSFVEIFLLNLEVNKATGLDNISAKFLKYCAKSISPIVCKLMNVCIDTNSFPSDWKCAKVSPLFKKGKKEFLCNYRPISILPVLSKCLEKHIHVHFYNFLNVHNLISDSQSGFRANHSCQTALTNITNTWYDAIDKGLLTGVLFLDFRKAFDLVNHQILLSKLKLYGCSSKTVEFFQSYLSGRFQILNFKNTLSDSLPLSVGVPQGSILGPLLFILYVNDLPLATNHCSLYMYADDTAAQTHAKSLDIVNQYLSDDAKLVSKWCDINKMCINTEKTKAMLVTTSQRKCKLKDDLSVLINNVNIENVNNEKLLGVTIDSCLSWDQQFTNICKKDIMSDFSDEKVETIFKSVILYDIL